MPEKVSSEYESSQCLTKLISFTISNIIYLRDKYDESSFSTISFETLKLRLLNRNSSNSKVKQIIEQLCGMCPLICHVFIIA